MTTCILLAAACFLPALIVSIGRCYREKDLLTSAMAFLCAFLVATFVSAFLQADHIMSLFDTYGLSIRDNQSHTCVALLSGSIFFGLLLLITVRYIKKQDVWKWIIAAFVSFLFVMMIMGIGISMTMGCSLDQGFFLACCGTMGASGIAWGLTYKEICVIGNIYMEAVICLLSALWSTWTAIKAYRQKNTAFRMLIMLAGLLYGTIYVFGFLGICYHYAMPLEEAFDLCYHELLALVSLWHTTYNIVNYLVFIILFLVLTLGNILAAKFLLPITYRIAEKSLSINL